jgi:hypothetical protein
VYPEVVALNERIGLLSATENYFRLARDMARIYTIAAIWADYMID